MLVHQISILRLLSTCLSGKVYKIHNCFSKTLFLRVVISELHCQIPFLKKVFDLYSKMMTSNISSIGTNADTLSSMAEHPTKSGASTKFSLSVFSFGQDGLVELMR